LRAQPSVSDPTERRTPPLVVPQIRHQPSWQESAADVQLIAIGVSPAFGVQFFGRPSQTATVDEVTNRR